MVMMKYSHVQLPHYNEIVCKNFLIFSGVLLLMQFDFNQNTILFIQNHEWENIVHKTVAIRSRYVNEINIIKPAVPLQL